MCQETRVAIRVVKKSRDSNRTCNISNPGRRIRACPNNCNIVAVNRWIIVVGIVQPTVAAVLHGTKVCELVDQRSVTIDGWLHAP